MTMVQDTVTPARRPAFSPRLQKAVIPIATVVAIVVIWELAVRIFAIPPYIAPAPSAVVAEIGAKWPQLWANFLPTLFEAVAGFLMGNLVAILIAVAFVHNKTVERAFFPLAVFINTIPILAIAPILVLIFGTGMSTKVIIAALICFFPTLVNMVRGLESVPNQSLELARILSASKSEVFWKIRLPYSLPFLFAALKIAATTSVIGAIVGEWVGSDRGLGALILDATFNFRAPLLYAAVLMSSGLSVLMFAAVAITERLTVRW
ncbi:ABC transporter permease [Paracoccus pacificus]|uniref:ABC transporter permease n=1 Tax=Paracoccus pacificus TaxID=1463598 RepID=A0ABW4R7G3_9RHOB